MKAFWNYVRSIQKAKENMADLRTCEEGIHAKTSVSKVNILTSFVVDVFTEENLNTVPKPGRYYVQIELNDLPITLEIVIFFVKVQRE